MLWEAVFFLLILKIPVIYLALVGWWAVRSEPDKGDPATVAAVTDTPLDGPGRQWRARRSRRPLAGRPHGRPSVGRAHGRIRPQVQR